MLQFLVHFYISGLDTIIAGLQWSLFYHIKFPDIQVKTHQDILLYRNNTSSLLLTEQHSF